MKIIYLINELGKGGSERQLYLLLKYMDRSSAEPTVVVFNPSTLADYADDIRALGIRVLPVPASENSPLKRLLWMIRLLRQETPDVVHSWSAPDNPYAGIAGLLAGVPLRVGSLRNSLQNRSFLELPSLLQKFAIHTCPYLLVNANSIQAELVERNFPANRLYLIENCVEIPPEIEKSDFPPVFSDNFRLVGMVSNLRRNKNVHVFIEGLAMVLPRFPELRGVIVGQPIPDELDYYQSLQKLIEEKELSDQVFMLGFRDDAPQLVARFEVFCLLSDFEGSPNAVLEAMAAGRPVIATNTSGIPELVQDGIAGYLVPPGDAKAFADALEKMLNNPDREEMGAKGRMRVKSHHSCQEAASRLLELYQQLLSRKK